MELPPQAYRPPLDTGAPWRLPVPAPFRRRAWAWAVDYLLGLGPLLGVAVWTRVAYGDTLDAAEPSGPALALLPALVWWPVCWFLNRLLLTSRTGRSVGKALVGIRIVDIPTWRPPGVGQLFHREIQHGADFSLFSRGWDRVDGHWLGQTYADELSKTAVIVSNPPDVWDERDPYGLG